jgi:hypothetical protein
VPFAFLIPAAASLIGGKMSSDAASDAAGQANAQNQRGLDLQREMLDEQRRLSEPYRQAGLTGQNRLMELLGLGGNTGAAGYGQYSRDFGMQDFQQDPGYRFRLGEGLKAMSHQAGARGGLISGQTMKGMEDYRQGLASQEYGNAFNRYQTNRQNQLAPLGSLMSSGQAAAVGQAAQAGQYGANASNMLSQMGVNTGGATLAGSSAYGKAIGDIGAQFGRSPPNFNNMFGSSSSQAGMYGGAPAEGFYY